jgi:hypothetical protein
MREILRTTVASLVASIIFYFGMESWRGHEFSILGTVAFFAIFWAITFFFGRKKSGTSE